MDVNVKERAGTTASPCFSLKAKALLAWERERQTREAARIERRARELQCVRDKFEKMFGSDHDINIGIDDEGHITVVVEDLRFITHVYSFGGTTVSVFLTEKCPRCGEDVPVGSISDLADLGELINGSALERKHTCYRNQS
jgi:hypothetical protein